MSGCSRVKLNLRRPAATGSYLAHELEDYISPSRIKWLGYDWVHVVAISSCISIYIV